MFEKAIQKAMEFTRPLHSISRTYGGLVIPGTSTFFFVNDMGVAITCNHVLNLLPTADRVNEQFIKFKEERTKIARDGNYKRMLKGLELKYRFVEDTTVQLKNRYMNCFDKIDGVVTHSHPTLDLAIIEFKGFNERHYTSHARFLKDSSVIMQGKYLCRVGFPFPEFNNFRHDQPTDDIEWTNQGNTASPTFPIDGIVTRFVGDTSGHITGIEMSTPSLKGQSGGPLFDVNGIVYGMVYATNHLHLGFDIRDREIINEGKKSKVSNYPFLHVGLCVHVDRIKEFLNEHKVSFSEE